MEKQNKAGVNNEIWFHLYHIAWATGIVSLFIFLDWWLAIIIISLMGFYFVWKY